MSKDAAIVSCVTLTGSEYVAMLAQAAELAKEITSLLNRLADERTENMRLRAALREVMDDLTLISKNHWLPVGLLDDVIYVNARAALDGQPAPGKEEA